MYNIVADMHTHTLASTHAYSTLTEMVDAARDKGLYAIAVTDHARKMPGAPREWYFGSLYQIPLMFHGVKCVMGIEANVIDFNGTLDIEYEDYKNIDWVVASIHEIPGIHLDNPTVGKTTDLWMKVAQNPLVNVIAHSGSPLFEYDYETVIPEFGRRHKLVEINSHTFDVRAANAPYCKKIAQACIKHGVPIIVNSDAHFQTEVGNLRKALDLLESINFPEELIVNSSVDRLNEYLDKYSRIKENRKT